MSEHVGEAVVKYWRDTRILEALPTSTETTFYPDIRTLLTSILRSQNLPFTVRTGTSEKTGPGHDMPDFVLGDSDTFVGVYGEVKRANVDLVELATSTEQKDQIGRYLAQTGVVLLCNVRGFGLLVCDPKYERDEKPVPPAMRQLAATVDLWSAVTGGQKPRCDPSAIESLVGILTRAVTEFARIAAPSDLARILARQAREAKDALAEDLSDMALTSVLRRMEVDAVPHGFRSTFRDWVGELTSFPRELAEQALAHSLESKVEAAYRRGDALEKRRQMMESWSKFCLNGS